MARVKRRPYRPPSDGTGLAALLLGGGCLVVAVWYLLIFAAVVTAIVLAWRNFG